MYTTNATILSKLYDDIKLAMKRSEVAMVVFTDFQRLLTL